MKYLGWDGEEKGTMIEDWCCTDLEKSFPKPVDWFAPDNTFLIYSICTPPGGPPSVSDMPEFKHYATKIKYCPFCSKKLEMEIVDKHRK